jgi:hypothetical protein
MLVTNRSRDGHKMLSFSNAQQLLPASIGDGCYEMRKGIVGDRLTAPRRPTPRRMTERDQPRLIASYLTRPAEYSQSEGGGFVAAGSRRSAIHVRFCRPGNRSGDRLFAQAVIAEFRSVRRRLAQVGMTSQAARYR